MFLPPRYSLTSAPPENWASRKMTNSAGFTGAMPISTDDLAGVDDLRRVGLRVALDVERLSGVAPNSAPSRHTREQERVDRAADALPQSRVVRLEDDPLGALEDRLLEVVEEPADVEVAPRRVARERARAPDADAAARERRGCS